MSISSVGQASGAGNLSQLLASMLSRIKSSAADDIAATSTTTASSTTTPETSNALTGTDTSNLSDQVIGVLVMMQAQDSSQSGDQTNDADSTPTSASDPVSQAFSSLDTDGDGTISQSELESAIEGAGGTADEADSVYAALGGTSQSGISETAFTSAAQAGGPPPGGPPPGGPGGPGGAHGHHHHHGGSGSSDSASQIFAALDTNQDGTVSANELSAALGGSTTAKDGSTSSSSDIFSTIDTNGDGSISQDELSSYLDNLQSQSGSDQSTLSAFQQLANQSYSAGLSLMASTTMTQSTTA